MIDPQSPLGIMGAWLKGDGQAMVFHVAAALGQKPSNPAAASDALFWWIPRHDNPLERRGAALRLRALVDFECFLARNEAHQSWIDEQLLTGVDTGCLPQRMREGFNASLGTRAETRRDLLEAAATWPGVRPDDQSIYAWWRAEPASAPETP